VAYWVQTHPDNTIRYVVGLCGLPSRSWSDAPLYDPTSTSPNPPYDSNSVSFMISEMLRTDHTKPFDATTFEGGTDRFSVAEYGAPLVAWLDCGSYEATKAYINKEIVAAANRGLQSDGITISGTAAGVGGSKWILDDTNVINTLPGLEDYFDSHESSMSPSGNPLPDEPDNYYDALIDAGVSASEIIHHSQSDDSLISPPSDPVADPSGYGSFGIHSGQLRSGSTDGWPVDGDQGPAQVVFTFTNALHIGWWVGTTVESFNGKYGYPHGDPTEFFASSAFGGTTETATISGVPRTYYTNTPICFVGSTEEPGEAGCEGEAYFGRWAKGWSTLESAWAGRRTTAFLAVTDVCLDP
jgi:hypothetical protein